MYAYDELDRTLELARLVEEVVGPAPETLASMDGAGRVRQHDQDGVRLTSLDFRDELEAAVVAEIKVEHDDTERLTEEPFARFVNVAGFADFEGAELG